MVNSAHRITSPFIPIVDPTDTSCVGKVKEFFSGYYYRGSIRYVKLTINRNDRARRYEERPDAQNLRMLKIVSIFSGIAPLIGAGFLLFNWLDRKINYYSYIPMGNGATSSSVPVMKPKFVPVVPAEKNLPFKNFLLTYAPHRLFGEFSVEEWVTMIKEYRGYRQNEEQFLQEMVLLKGELFQWRQELLEPLLRINKETFVESQVPELLTTALDILHVERINEEAKASFVQNRTNAFFNQTTLPAKHEISQFIASHRIHSSSFFQSVVKEAKTEQMAIIAESLKEVDLEQYKTFLETLLQSSEPSEKIAQGFVPFWDRLQTRVANTHGTYALTFWQYLLAFIRDVEMPMILSTIPATLSAEDKKYLCEQMTAFWAMRRRDQNIDQVTELAKKIIAENPLLRAA